PHGFSRVAWAHLAPPTRSRYEPQHPPAFLPAPTGSELPTLLAQSALTDVVQAGLVRLTTEADSSQLPIADIDSPASNSMIKVEGALAGRRVLQLPSVPLAPAGLPIRRTRVLVAVGLDG